MRTLEIYSKKHGTKVVYYDDEDHDIVSKYNWHIQKGARTFYAITNIKLKKAIRVKGKLKKTVISMHRVIMGLHRNKNVDHKDHNGLNNKRDNLRMCSPGENAFNRRPNCNNKYGLKGVTFYKKTSKYQAFIMVKKKQIHLGYYPTITDAAIAYNKAAIVHFKEFAVLNNI